MGFNFSVRFSSAGQYRQFIGEVAPPIWQLIAERAPQKADPVWEKVEAAARSQAADDGSVTFDNEIALRLRPEKALNRP